MNRLLPTLWPALFAAAALLASPARAGEGSDLQEAKQRLQRMLKWSNPDSPPPGRSLSSQAAEIARLETRLSALAGAAELRSLAHLHLPPGPCFRYGTFPALPPGELARLIGTYGAEFLSRQLTPLARRVAERENRAHRQAASEEYLDLIRRAAQKKFEPGEAAYWVALAERREELLQAFTPPPAPPPLAAEQIQVVDPLLHAHPALGTAENRLALFYAIAAFETEEKGRRLAEPLRRRPAGSSCASALELLAPADSAERRDGWGHPFTAAEAKAGRGCQLTSYGKDGVPGGQGADADRHW